jgi:N-acyl homoserine lactone hydrolase
MMKRHPMALIAALTTLLVGAAWPAAQSRKPVVTTPRIYVFDTGTIKGLDPKLFNFTRDELKEVDFVDTAYLIVHPRGTLLFDTGAIPDADFKGGGAPVTEGIMSATKPLGPQLAAAGFTPSDITYLAMSHYHSDHTANANTFAGSTWIVQKAERDFMFSDNPQGIIRPAHYSALKDAKTRILDNEDLDVFGDGTVVIKTAPGHTPGHQVLFVRLARRGPVLLAGDLYHYPEERTTGRVPTFEFNPEQSRATRQKMEAFINQTGAELWIEHDMATHARLPKSPAFID